MLAIFRPNRMASLLAALALAVPIAAQAQTYPTSNPTYIPTAVLAPATLSAAGTAVFQANGIGTVIARITGTGTGIAGTFQVATERAGTVNWTNISAQPVGGVGGKTIAIVSTGLYRLDVAGAAQVRFNLTAITGSIAIDWSGSPSNSLVEAAPQRRQTYSAMIVGLAPAASATDFLTLTGSATKTVRIQRAACSGTSTAAATATVVALKRSTANSAGTSTAPAAVQHDANDAAATATVAAYTANPTVGSVIGSGLRAGLLTTVTAASTAVPAQPLVFDFGQGQTEEVMLRGVAQVFALNGNAASFTSGASLNCSIQWTEE